jgi:hypothetical protein
MDRNPMNSMNQSTTMKTIRTNVLDVKTPATSDPWIEKYLSSVECWRLKADRSVRTIALSRLQVARRHYGQYVATANPSSRRATWSGIQSALSALENPAL